MAQTTTEVQASIIVEPKIYELPSPDQHVATITKAEDLGMVKHDLYGDQHKVKIHVRIDDEKSSKDETLFVFLNATVSLGEKARLGKFLRSLGIDTSKPFDLAEIVGMRINVGIIHNKKGDKTYANIDYVSRIRAKKTTTPVVDVEEV